MAETRAQLEIHILEHRDTLQGPIDTLRITDPPFNEPDQMLSYRASNMVLGPNTPDPPANPCDYFGGECVENRVDWVADPLLPGTYNDWLTDIISFVKDPVDASDPVHSSLGESSKMFISGTGYDPNMDPVYLPPNQNPKLDLIDVDEGLYNEQDLQVRSAEVDEIRETYAANGVKRPFSNGEFTHCVEVAYGTKDYGLAPFFHNYEIAFHNELWSSAFSGKFAAGMSWEGPRVFWWEGSQLPPPDDLNNSFVSSHPVYQFDNRPGERNDIRVNNQPFSVQNRSVFHNFKPLTDLLNHPSWLAYDFFNGEYTVGQWPGNLEAYYLQNGEPGEATVAIGWVRKRNSSILNTSYLASTAQQFFNCEPPDPVNGQGIYLLFEPGTYHVSWFPTRMNSTVHPPDAEVSTLFGTTLLYIDLEGQFGGIDNDYLDTLRGDYAFIITPEPFVKSLPFQAVADDVVAEGSWDFGIYPNPARNGFTLRFQDETPKEVMILDLSGRIITRKAGVTTANLQFPELRLAQGAYWVRVADGLHQRTKKLIMQ
ncbi:MAG: T9SS type A sorting domain-containing protein [Flavobacteriales bacterium]|nr:T9SS type A sorting domain-containing protein [Flavobacteriales bacterium]